MAKRNKELLALSEGIIATITNGLLFSLFWIGSSVGKSGSMGAYQAFEEAFGTLESINYATLKQTVYKLKKRGLITQRKQKNNVRIGLSSEGKRYLLSLLPKEPERQSWQGSLFMVTYDIPEKRRVARNRFRAFLGSIGCAMIQESVWVTPYNPTRLIAGFVKDHGIEETVIISNFGKDGTVGGEDIRELVRRVFKLKKLDLQYQEFINRIKSKDTFTAADYLCYLSILKEDPGLPDEFGLEGSYRIKAEQYLLSKRKK